MHSFKDHGKIAMTLQSIRNTYPNNLDTYINDIKHNYDVMPVEGVDLRRYDDRIMTFEKWPATFLSAEKMAGNGFYYLGRGDGVRCAFCMVQIINWVEGDDPTKEHQNWSPNCRFACRLTDSNTVDYKKILSPEINLDKYYRFERKHQGSETTGRNKHGYCVPVDAPLKLPGAAHPCYESEDARLCSFQDSQCMRQSPENLARAGFFYVGPDDETKCYYCDGCLKNWGPDDVPWEQHARWFGTCAYLKFVKGQDYLQKRMTKRYDMLAPTVERVVVKQRTLTGSLDPDNEAVYNL